MIAGCYLGGRGRRYGSLASLSILALFIAGAGSPENTSVKEDSAADRDTAAPFAVVELFTSESCSSCPAADRLLSEMTDEARKHGQRLLPLAFHVDYWNTGPDADPFSSSAFVSRQRNYAAALDEEDVYTPQMIVNGKVAFVGHERPTAERQIKAALNRPATTAVKLSIEDTGNPEVIKVTFDVRKGTPATANLQLAVVERNLSTVRLGKRVDNVVRSFKTVALNKGSNQTVELKMPRDLVRKNASVVGYVQDSRTLAIQGAASVDMSNLIGQRVASTR